MTQTDILKLLERKEWTNTKEMSKELDLSKSSLCTNLNKLIKTREIERKQTKVGRFYEYEYKLI